MSIYIRKSHNVSLLLYHIVCPAKWRQEVFSEKIINAVRDVCEKMERSYDLQFVEIGADIDHMHFLVQSVPSISPTRLVNAIKSITAREVFAQYPELLKQIWSRALWTSGYFVTTVGKHGDEKKIYEYIKRQGTEGYKPYLQKQLKLLEW